MTVERVGLLRILCSRTSWSWASPCLCVQSSIAIIKTAFSLCLHLCSCVLVWCSRMCMCCFVKVNEMNNSEHWVCSVEEGAGLLRYRGPRLTEGRVKAEVALRNICQCAGSFSKTVSLCGMNITKWLRIFLMLNILQHLKRTNKITSEVLNPWIVSCNN